MPAPSMVFLLFPLLSHHTFLHVRSQGVGFISKTCRRTDDFGFCVTTLQAVNESYTADLTGLDSITINLGIKNATITLSVINSLLQRTRWGTPLSNYLEYCQEMYSYAVINLRFAMDGLQKKAFAQVKSGIKETVINVGRCDNQKMNSPPLSKQNLDLRKLANLAFSILECIEFQV